MAKKINIEEAQDVFVPTDQIPEPDAYPEIPEMPVVALEPEEKQVKLKAKADEVQKPIHEADERVKVILKAHPDYESLYIDSHGGSYGLNTPQAIRGAAILYKNPFYKP